MSRPNQPYYILIDRQTAQVQQQENGGSRLNTLYGALTSAFGVSGSGSPANSPLKFTDPAHSSSGTFASDLRQIASSTSAGIYAVPTRGVPFSSGQLAAIKSWVFAGGKLLLMSNHTHFSVNDAVLAAEFGFTLTPKFIAKPDQITTMDTAQFVSSAAPPIFSGVNAIVAHDGCGISFPSSSGYSTLVEWPSGAVIWSGSTPTDKAPTDMVFAALANGAAVVGSGKVIVTANSGWIGDQGSLHPAPGIISFENNLRFVLNVFSYLAGIPAGGIFGIE